MAQRDSDEGFDAAVEDERFMEGWRRPSISAGARARRSLLSLLGIAGSAGEAVGESWPLLMVGLVGGALFFGGLIVLIYGW